MEEIISKFPEPFGSVVRSGYAFSIDYRSDSDHEYLKEHGYTIHTGSDCSNYVVDLGYLNATSYGNWGTLYSGNGNCDEVKEYRKALAVLCDMFKERVITLWRIRMYIDKVGYNYDEDTKRWTKYDSEKKEWVECENPLAEEDGIDCDKLF